MKLVSWEALEPHRRAAYIEYTQRMLRGAPIGDVAGLAHRTYETAVLMFVNNNEHHAWPGGEHTPIHANTYVDGLFDALIGMGLRVAAFEATP